MNEIIPQASESPLGNSTEWDYCEANVLISLIDGIATRVRCEYRATPPIYITTENQPKHLCDFHRAFMDFAIAQDEQEGGAA